MSESVSADLLADEIHRRTSLSSSNEKDLPLQTPSVTCHIDNRNSGNYDIIAAKLEQYETIQNASSKYLTPNLVNFNRPTFSNEGVFQDNSPGMFSVRTISTTALNDMLYWDNNNDIINSKSDLKKSSWRLSNDNSVPNRIYEISGDTTLRSDSKNYPVLTNDGEHSVNLTTLPPTEEDIPEIRHSRMSPQIDKAAELLRSEIYSNPNKRESSYIPLRLTVSTQQENTLHSNVRDNITHMVFNNQATPLSSIRLKAFEKYSTDSGNVYMDSPNQPTAMVFPSKTTPNTWHYSDEEREKYYSTYNENDRAESPQSDVPLDKETNMPFQHVEYDSVISLDSTNPSFDDIFSAWKIMSVLVTCIIMPPLFYIIYYAGRGGMSDEQAERLILKDAYLQDPLRGFYWDVDITWFKKLCFYLGTVELFLVIACICIGFAVGLSKGQ